jgi:hypothetical protein
MKHLPQESIIPSGCGSIHLVATLGGRLNCGDIRIPDEDMMTLKFLSRFLSLGVAAVLATALATHQADAAPKRHAHVAQNSSVNYSYQAGPRTRIYVTKRSWLDAGTEVLPGERKFTDYATGGPDNWESLDRLSSTLDRRRAPLSTPADVGGYPTGFPLY